MIKKDKKESTHLEEMNQREENRLMEIARKYDDCIYLEVSGTEGDSLLAYHLGDSVGIVKPWVHLGMFSDSVLYVLEGDDAPCNIDFRYFPMGFNGMEVYWWSENIKLAVIKNETGYPLMFNDANIPAGATATFTRDATTWQAG